MTDEELSDGLMDSDSAIYLTSASADTFNSPYPELSPTHQPYSSLNPFHETMQSAVSATGLYQSPYSASSGAAVAFANYYHHQNQQNNPYSGIISQSYNGQYSSFSNSGSTSQSFGNCQQSGIDYSSYSGFSHPSGYSSYYTSAYGPYIPNSSSSNVNNSSPPSGVSSSSNNSSTATYQLTQLPQQSDPSLSHYHIDDCPSPHIKTDVHLNSSGTKKGSTKSGRGRGRRQPNPSPDPENNLERVFIWDLDETIILFLSYLNGARNSRMLEESSHMTVYELAVQLEQLINRFAETHFFYEDLEEVDQNHVDDTATDDSGQDLSNYNFQTDGFHTSGSCTLGLGLASPVRGGAEYLKKMAFRYRRIKEIYNQYRDNVGGLLSTQDRENLYKIQRKWDVITDNWTLLALKCLQLINSRPKCVNVLVTSLPLVPTLAKVMIFGLASNFNIENIYSAAKTGKEDIFARIVNKFGKKCTYVVIGDGREEEAAAQKHSLPFWPVNGITDLIALQHALELGHL